MNTEALLHENLMLKQAIAELQEQKRELIRVNLHNVNEYDKLAVKYRERCIQDESTVPHILRKEVSE